MPTEADPQGWRWAHVTAVHTVRRLERLYGLESSALSRTPASRDTSSEHPHLASATTQNLFTLPG